jgi:hypothetical protein
MILEPLFEFSSSCPYVTLWFISAVTFRCVILGLS